MKIIAQITLSLLFLSAKAEDTKAGSTEGLASTSWNFTNNQGEHRELRFEPDASLWMGYLRVLAKRSKVDQGFPFNENEYEVLKERGAWTQDGTSVRITTLDEGTTLLSAKVQHGDSLEGTVAQLNNMVAESEKHPVHPTITYVGTIHGSQISGIAESSAYSLGSKRQWVAEKIIEPKKLVNGAPKVLVSCIPSTLRFQAKLISENIKSGSAQVKAEISATGDVTKVTLIQATKKEFGACATAAVSHWKFTPKVKDGEAIPCTATIPLDFVLAVTAK